MRRRSGRGLVVVLPVAACLLGACAGAEQQGTASQRMDTWVRGTSLGESIGTLVADNARIAEVARNGSGALHAACGTIVADAAAANGNLPSPDPGVTALLSRAYTLEGTAGSECYDGAGDPSRLRKAERDGIKADALYDQALQRIRAIDGRPPVTTTTTGNSGDSGAGGIFG